MRAAVITAYGSPPALSDHDAPTAAPGQAIVALRAAALNPVDIAVASGTFPAGSPPLPYVPGAEGVGTVVESGRFAVGTRVWASGRGLGVLSDGAFAERFAVADEVLVEVPEAASDELAAALGIAGLAGWLPVAWAAPVREGETVLVLGATGNVGAVAVQGAKLLGAGRIVAAGRDAARLAHAVALGADATVVIGDDFREQLAAACEGAPPTLVVDALWGPPLEAALTVTAPGARIVHLGQSAGPMATIASGLVRGKGQHIIGYSNFGVPPDAVAKGYRDLVEHAVAGRIRLDLETIPLDAVTDAWARQAAGPDAKLVLIP